MNSLTHVEGLSRHANATMKRTSLAVLFATLILVAPSCGPARATVKGVTGLAKSAARKAVPESFEQGLERGGKAYDWGSRGYDVFERLNRGQPERRRSIHNSQPGQLGELLNRLR